MSRLAVLPPAVLTQICIRDFAIIHRLEQDLHPGMTVITGETGAGKSIIVDALGLALGARAHARCVRPGAARTEISAVFSLEAIPAAGIWLAERELERGAECQLRRTVTAEGRSRAWVNGQPCPLQDLQELGALLAAIHGQHAHYALLHRKTQQALLDAFGKLEGTAQKVRKSAQRWLELGQALQQLQAGGQDSGARQELLEYQVQELERLATSADEIADLEEEHRQLAAADALLAHCGEALASCDEQEQSATSLLGRGMQALAKASKVDKRLAEALELLTGAQSRSREAAGVLSRYLDSFQADPERLAQVESRMQAIHQAARRHKVDSKELPALHLQLQEELRASKEGGKHILQAQQEQKKAEAQYRQQAQILSEKRTHHAKSLAGEMDGWLQKLDMVRCHFEVHLLQRTENTPAAGGAETVEFRVSTNPGHPAGALEQIASGGELSRIGLALQAAALGKSAPPTLVFDEVDAGIGSSAAEQVGTLLHQLGERGQTLCVTHLAQVAGRADHHLVADKKAAGEDTRAELHLLAGEDERVEEIARLLAGRRITGKSRAHAKEILRAEVE